MVTDELRIEFTADTGNAVRNITDTANALNGLGDQAKTADTDMSQLVRAMTDAAANMVSISQNISQSVSGLSGFQNGSDEVQSSITGLNMRFDTLNASVQQSYLAFDAAAASVNNLAASSETSAAALDSIVNATDGFAGRMGELQTNTQATSDEMSGLRREFSEALTTLHGFSDNMGNAGKDAEDAAQKIRELSEQVRKLPSQQPLALAAGFKTLKGVVATLGIGKLIKDSNDAYNVQMQNELKLTAHMKQRMNATDDQVSAIKRLASEQQKIGVIGDEIQLAGAQQLTTYARQASTLQTLLPAMNNLIAQNSGYEASVSDATSAADMLGRALNGQYTSLKRMGVTFSEAQENVLKYGTEEQKAAVLADAINSKVGNMNELLAQTPTGKLKQLQNDFGDLQEQFGATFQPLISALVPVARSALETLATPIMNISRGIATIGSAIASVDSPAVRGIALAAAGLAVMNKLKLAIGGTSAGLLLLGVALSGIIGGMQEQQDGIGNIVSNAYNAAANGAENAKDATADYNDELANTQKAVNRLAGFDTITKLSGSGSSNGALVSALLGENGLDDLAAAVTTADELNSAVDSMKAPELSFSEIWHNADVELGRTLDTAEFFTRNLAYVFTHWGDDEAVYGPLNSMTNKIEDILNGVGLDGTGFVNYWKGVGDDIYNAMAGKDSKIYDALKDLDKAFKDHGLTWKFGMIDVGQSLADSLYVMTHAEEIVQSGNADEWVQRLINGMQGTWAGAAADFWYNNAGVKEKLQSMIKASDYSARDITLDIQEGLRAGMTSEQAQAYARSNMYYAFDSEELAQKWFDDFVAPSDRQWLTDVNSVEVMRQQIISSGEISSSAADYRGVPTTPTGIPSNVPTENVTHITVYVDGVERDARVDNAKKE